ncbi:MULTISPECIES: DUF6894 family protein [unclassified Bradyrhizobium]
MNGVASGMAASDLHGRNEPSAHGLISMSKYYFHISNGHPFYDPEGEELPSDEAAWEVAVMTVRDIDSNLDLDQSNQWSVVVTREDTPVFRIDVRAKRIEIEPS